MLCAAGLGLLALLLGQPLSVWAQLQDPIQVETGLLSGTPGAHPSVRVYKGIPFAAPPVDDLRWRPPQLPRPWQDVRAADAFSPACSQDTSWRSLPWTEEFMHQGPVSEDCLYLNVWTAARAPNEQRPVLVYIYGGGFNQGSTAVPLYDGEALARHGVVVVTLNYRVGVLGFLAHPELTAESDHGASGNYGLLDQVAALRWVRDNIAAFGGDPDRITIAGQSAGAMSVYLLTASSLAEGLFHRAILQSGPGALASFGVVSTRRMTPPLADAEQDGLRFARAHGATSIRALRAMPAQDLMASENDGPPLNFRPIVDGWFLPASIDAIYARGDQHDVPMLSGMNADEPSAAPNYGQLTAEAFKQQARERYGEQSDAFLELYPATSDEEASQSQKASARDFALVALRRLTAERAQTSETADYLYYFDRAIPWPDHPEFGAFHSGELPYVFDNLHVMNRPWEAVDRRLADLMASYWVNFATDGNPNGAGLPSWPTYRPESPDVMVLGEDVGPRVMPDDARYTFFDAVLTEQEDAAQADSQ